MHPDVAYINSGFHGFKYWMAYTSYPYSIGKYENPCIAVRNDGINWTTPCKLKNPIAPPPKDVQQGGHFSDTDILYNNNKLVVYYVYNKDLLINSRIYSRLNSNSISFLITSLI